MITVVIPTYNEAQNLSKLLEKLDCEVIVVDSGSTDGTVEVAKRYGVPVVHSKVPNRGHQMNLGAKHASGDLLFLHADSRLPKEWKSYVDEALDLGLWGGFKVRFDSNDLFYRFVEFRSNIIRAKLFKVLLGDQGIFVRRKVFYEIGGFPEVPVFEDLLLSKKLRRIGGFRFLSKPIISSARRFEEHGKVRTYFAMFVAMNMHHLRFSLGKVKRVYSRLQRRPYHFLRRFGKMIMASKRIAGKIKARGPFMNWSPKYTKKGE
ncbi:MAG: TIGR04283 family arsenosugar biosynthesis glycosyltransferase [Candidatus Nanoarchaeia archaeon]